MRIFSFILCACIYALSSAWGQEDVTNQRYESLFQDTLSASGTEGDSIRQDTIKVNLQEDIEFFGKEEPLEMTLIFDLRDLLELKDDEDYMDAVLRLQCDEDSVTWNIRIKARGEFRRNFCSFPPIMINVKGVVDLPAELSEKKTMKLVTHCRDRNDYREYVFTEYLVYKMYELVSPFSFKVRLVKINYVDKADPENVISSYGFLIENLEHLAERNDAREADDGLFQQQDMVPEIMAGIDVFQYMIGNVDWQAGYHNIKVLEPKEASDDGAIPVPYDFDQTGFVNPEYGVIRTNLGLKTMRDRRYLGDCELNDMLPQTVEEFAVLRDSFTDLIEGFEWIDNRSKRELIAYLDEFFDPLMNDRSAFVEMLQRECILILR